MEKSPKSSFDGKGKMYRTFGNTIGGSTGISFKSYVNNTSKLPDQASLNISRTKQKWSFPKDSRFKEFKTYIFRIH